MPPVLIMKVQLMEPTITYKEGQMYHIVSENFYLVPTAEVTDEHIQGYYS